jgi:hypothetical protein
MKYLKIFETFGEYYSEISSDDYESPKGDIEAMSENEFLKIEYKIKSKGWETYRFKDTMLKYTEDFKNVCEITFIQEDVEFYNHLVITKMSDEFYYILLMIPRTHNDIKFKYYKADQLEGLEKFIDEVL